MAAPFTPPGSQDPHRQLRSAPLPGQLAELLENLLDQLVSGQAVPVLSLDHELTPQQAAELLGVSRTHLADLIDLGELPHCKVGARRRLYLEDVLAYKAGLNAERQPDLQAFSEELQALE
ncbi:helix-turn-helix domain-containing protein (plasmid) [Deinococcus taeanensis]|uniref:helix-turn-helix domain-containing protein n=1 Tax=Deinococcus taeanensis TaxID=2737050 RepID=UPI001CDCB541|nr:helix-turn-helix domain-containing protein [Deinococcus taeanensis]UBV45539.1 helix-turn-helix domain-containing protein [Deinococcus taeanensis]